MSQWIAKLKCRKGYVGGVEFHTIHHDHRHDRFTRMLHVIRARRAYERGKV